MKIFGLWLVILALIVALSASLAYNLRAYTLNKRFEKVNSAVFKRALSAEEEQRIMYTRHNFIVEELRRCNTKDPIVVIRAIKEEGP